MNKPTKSPLPKSWLWVEVNQVAEAITGNTPPTSDKNNYGGDIPFIKPPQLVDAPISSAPETLSISGAAKARVLPTGTVLVSCIGNLGKTAVATVPCATNQQINALVFDQTIEPKFGFYYAQTLGTWLASVSSATTITIVNKGKFETAPFPLAPNAEQTRIVEKLEELLSDLDVGVAELKAAQKKLVQFRQSLLKAAVEGALTAEWRTTNQPKETGTQLLQRILTERHARWEAKQLTKFKEQGKAPPKDWQAKYPEPVKPDTNDLPELPEGWVWTSLDMLGEIASGVAKGTKRNADVQVREVPYLRVANVQRGFLDLSEIKTILATERDIAELTLQAGDVLFNEGGDRDKLGRGWVWRDEVANCIHQNHVFRMRPYLPEVLPELISHHGNTFGKTWFQNAGKQTTNLASINMTMLRTFPVPLAPAAEQKELFVQLQLQVENLDRQAHSVELGLKQSAAQRKNILKAAFAGQLVPQDPNDEPASVLLERIRAEREQHKKQPKIKNPRKSTGMKKSDLDNVRDWIASKPDATTFNFSELRNSLPGDYEALKDSIFQLLAEDKPIIEQVFDRETSSLQFKRVKS
ncbi:MAG: restriction endonuclease subunit S [Patescibacteria group bacterium]